MDVKDTTMARINRDALAIIDEFVTKSEPDTNTVLCRAREISRLSSECRHVATEGKVCKTK